MRKGNGMHFHYLKCNPLCCCFLTMSSQWTRTLNSENAYHFLLPYYYNAYSCISNQKAESYAFSLFKCTLFITNHDVKLRFLYSVIMNILLLLRQFVEWGQRQIEKARMPMKENNEIPSKVMNSSECQELHSSMKKSSLQDLFIHHILINIWWKIGCL